MKFVTFLENKRKKVGLVVQDSIYDIEKINPNLPQTVIEIISDEDFSLLICEQISKEIKQQTIDQTQVNAQDKTDETLYGSPRSPIVPDFGFGVAYTKGNFYSGFSISHLNQSKFRYTTSQDSKLLRHYYLTAGYKYDIDPNFSLKPSVLIRAVNTSVPVQMDCNLLVDYTGSVWGGLGYRSGDAVSFLISGTVLSAGLNSVRPY